MSAQPSPGRDRRSDPPKRPVGPWTWFFLLLAATAALVSWLAADGGLARIDGDDGPRLMQGLLLAALIGAGVIHGRRLNWRGKLGAAFAWLAIGAALVLAYSFRFEAQDAWHRIAGEVAPGRAMMAGERTMTIRRANDGHFYAEALVNGVPVRFLIDSGATATVLSPRDAQRTGFNLQRLSYYQRLNTANGVVRAAPVTAARIDFGPIGFSDAKMLVTGAPLNVSLLGINTLNRFKSWRVERDTMTIEY